MTKYSKQYELFLKFTEHHEPRFVEFSDTRIRYCDGRLCPSCFIRDECHSMGVIPKEEFAEYKASHPEMFI